MPQTVQDAAPVMVAERESVGPAHQTHPETKALERGARPQANGQDGHVNGSNEDGGHADKGEHAEGGQGVVITDPADLPEDKKKKKKKRNKPASKRGLGKPTGMEQFFADPPLTPAEHAEEQQLYDLEISFLDRLLTAIQRFERTRRLSNERRDIFYKWLHYGGIRVGPNIGVGGQDQTEMDKDQVATALSRVQIPNELREALESTARDDAKYAIDFSGCMRSFLSRSAPVLFGFDTRDKVELVTTTTERFLDYLMQHDVCPEFNDEVLKTRNLCREATDEMWSCAEAQRWLPGQFNMACSTLYGSLGQNFDGTTVWGGDTQDGSAVFVGLTDEEADTIMRYAVAGAADQDVYEKYFQLSLAEDDEGALEVVKVIEGHGFEIIDLQDPTADCKDFYKANCATYRPPGRVIARAWKDPEAAPEDLTAEEKKAAELEDSPSEVYVFFVEEIVLQHLSVGQRILATVRQLNCGIWFFDEFTKIYPEFDLYLLNELMEDYKEPRYLPNAYVPGAPGWHTVHKDGEGDDRCHDVVEVQDLDANGIDQDVGKEVAGEEDEKAH